MLATSAIRTHIGHVMIEATVVSGDAAISGLLLRTNVMRGVAMSCEVSGPMAIIAGGAASGERFDGSSRAAMGASAGDGRGVTSLEPKGVGPTIIASNCATVSPGEFPSLLIFR